jgi:hypothetical protein
MSAADEGFRSSIAVNDQGLTLVQDSAGGWEIRGAADGTTYAAGDRLVWLLPLLERTPADVMSALSPASQAETPLTALVRFALTAPTEYWTGQAMGWLESGWPAAAVVDALAEIKDSPGRSQPLRHRALRLWRVAALRDHR